MKIIFDPAKRETTLYHRGLDMAQAGEVFAGQHITVQAIRFDYDEARFVTVGYLKGRNGGAGLDQTRRRHADHKHEESQ